MLYMFLVLPSLAGRGTAAGMAAMSAAGSSYSFLALVMALFMVGYVVRVADRLTIRAPALAAASAGPARPAAPAAMAAPAPPDTAPPGGRVSTSTFGPPLPGSSLRRSVQDRYGPHDGLHAGPGALAPGPGSGCSTTFRSDIRISFRERPVISSWLQLTA